MSEGFDRKQTSLVHVTTGTDIRVPFLPVSVPSPDVSGAPPPLLPPSLASLSFPIGRAWSPCCYHGNRAVTRLA